MAERVIELEVPFFDPEPNVPDPVVVTSDRACFLVYRNREGQRMALEFANCSISKYGYPNDEALGGHPLYGKGLTFYGVHEVLESSWIAELRRNNKVTFPESEILVNKHHFIFSFHDSTFECIASAFGPAVEFPQVNPRLLRLEESF